jgi:hypothetical protein
VTRMSDHDPKERRKNELDPNTQLEKRTLNTNSHCSGTAH